MIYLLLGDDSAAKDLKILEFKKKYLPSPEAFEFDYENFSASSLNPQDLRKALMAFPVTASQRLILLRGVSKLSAPNKKVILEFAREDRGDIVLILESEEAQVSGDFLRSFSGRAQVLNFSKGAKSNVFDMTAAMGSCDLVRALKLLDGLLEAGDHPLQIIGGLLWFWGKSRGRLSSEDFQKGLWEFQETDLNIKRSRLEPEQALEILVVKLTDLLSPKSRPLSLQYR